MKPTSRLRHFLSLTGSSLLAVSSAHAQSQWTNTTTGTQQWNTASNWDTDPTVPNGQGVSANLSVDLAVTQIVNLATPVTLGALTFGDSTSTFLNQRIQGSAITFDNNGSGATLTHSASTVADAISNQINLDDDLVIVNNGTLADRNNAIVLSGQITGTGGITINAGGTGGVYLSNITNNYSGGFTLNDASAKIVTGSNSNVFGTGTVTLNAGAIDTSFSGAATQLLNTTNANVWNGNWTMGGNWNNDGNVILGNNVTVTRGNGQFLNLGGNITETGGIRALTFAGGNASTITNLAGTNTYTGGTTVNTGSVSFLSKSAMSDTGSISFANGTVMGIALGGTDGWSSTGTGASTLNGILAGTGDNGQTITYTSAVGLNLILTGSHSYDAIGNLGSGATSLTLSGTGSLTINGDNTNTGGNTFQGGGSVTLNYDTSNGGTDATKLLINGGNGSVVFGYAASGTVPHQGYGGGTITLKGGSTNERASSTGSVNLNEGGTFIVRDGGTSTIRFNAITRAAGGTISFSEAGIVDTDTNNFGTSGANGILGGWATVGNDWAVSVNTGAANTAITALGSYDTWTNSVGSATANYLLNGADALGGALAAGTIKITDSGAGQSLDLNGSNLTITSASATALGGLMYAGGTNGNYEIKNTGATARILPSASNQELIFAVQSGNLTVSALIGNLNGRDAVTKTGDGRMIINAANSFRSALRVNQGVVQLTNASASGTGEGGIQVQNGAALELSGGLSFTNDALFITGNGVSNGGALRNVSGANTYTGPISTGIGGARVNNDDTGSLLTLFGVIATRSSGDLTVGGAGNTTASNVISGGGGLTKDGAGTLTLSAANTYIANTTVSDGTLTLASTGQLLFNIGGSGFNNSILGAGTINLDGILMFDLTTAGTTLNDTWNIVDVINLDESYGSNFTVSSLNGLFSDTSGLWTISENGVTYEFSEATGNLTVIPEPGAALLGSLGLLALLRRRR